MSMTMITAEFYIGVEAKENETWKVVGDTQTVKSTLDNVPGVLKKDIVDACEQNSPLPEMFLNRIEMDGEDETVRWEKGFAETVDDFVPVEIFLSVRGVESIEAISRDVYEWRVKNG